MRFVLHERYRIAQGAWGKAFEYTEFSLFFTLCALRHALCLSEL